jgi:pyruvate ferredoxin oxidoreductase gamma subunit
VTVPASEIAARHVGRPVPSAALLGAFAALTGVVAIGSVVSAVQQRLPGRVGQANAAAATETYELVRAHLPAAGADRAPSA